jgi:hypothetical protein
MTILPDNSIILTGTINAIGFTNGEDDHLVMGLDSSGNTLFVEYLGGALNEEWGDLIYSSLASRVIVFGQTQSLTLQDAG